MIVHRWKLKREVIKLIPALLAKADIPRENPSWYDEWSWVGVIAEKDEKYLVRHNNKRTWLPKEKVRILSHDD